jgi:hypothetical protein
LDVNEGFEFDYQVQDNITAKEELTVFISVRNLKSNHVDIVAETAFKFNKQGKYEISIACLDERGNYTRCSFFVEVGGEQ